MKNLLIFLLAFLPVSFAGAMANNPSVMSTPYVNQNDIVSDQVKTMCGIRAQIGYSSLQNAKEDIPLDESRKRLARLMLSGDFDRHDIPLEDHIILIRIVEFAYVLNKKYPQITPNIYFHRIYNSCLVEKRSIEAKF